MEFGRVSNLDSIQFSLPTDHSGTLKVLGGNKSEKLAVSIGCPIWAEPGFVGKIYPKKAKSKDFIKYYGAQFNAIELNISHYKPLDKETVEHWTDVTPSDFNFFPKVNQTISHIPYLAHGSAFMKDFMQNLQFFKHKLGMPFLQLPPYYDSTKADDLLDFLDASLLTRCAIELRHESWFKDEAVLRRLCNYFYKNNLTFLITDTAGRRDVLHQRLTTKTAFIRFVANDLHATDFVRMNEWINRIDEWINHGLEELFFFIHTPSHDLMPELAIYFITEFNKKTGLNLRLPKLISSDTEPQTLF